MRVACVQPVVLFQTLSPQGLRAEGSWAASFAEPAKSGSKFPLPYVWTHFLRLGWWRSGQNTPLEAQKVKLQTVMKMLCGFNRLVAVAAV